MVSGSESNHMNEKESVRESAPSLFVRVNGIKGSLLLWIYITLMFGSLLLSPSLPSASLFLILAILK